MEIPTIKNGNKYIAPLKPKQLGSSSGIKAFRTYSNTRDKTKPIISDENLSKSPFISINVITIKTINNE